MPKKAENANPHIENLAKEVPMLARGSKFIIEKRVPSYDIEKVVVSTLDKYPSDSELLWDSVAVSGNGWTLDMREPKKVNAIFKCRVGLALAGYSFTFFVRED